MSTDLEATAVHAWTTNGRRLHVDLADARAHELVAADGNLNPRSLALWQHALTAHPWELVVDVGVNYGEMLVGVDLPPAATLLGFEPNPVVRSLAARTFADNDLVVDLRPEAVAEVAGTAPFAVDPDWSGLSSLAATHGTSAAAAAGARGAGPLIEVAVTTLDAVVPADVASFCVKVDVEGFEQQVLAGARDCLARAVPWVLMLEVLHMPEGLLRALAASYPLLMLDVATGRPTRVTPDEVDDVLTSGRVYTQDCLLVSQPALESLLRGRCG